MPQEESLTSSSPASLALLSGFLIFLVLDIFALTIGFYVTSYKFGLTLKNANQ